MPRGIIVDHAGDTQSLYQRSFFRLDGLHVENLHGVLIKRHDIAGGIEAFLALINGSEFHSANRAAARFVALYPRVHGALVEEKFAP